MIVSTQILLFNRIHILYEFSSASKRARKLLLGCFNIFRQHLTLHTANAVKHQITTFKVVDSSFTFLLWLILLRLYVFLLVWVDNINLESHMFFIGFLLFGDQTVADPRIRWLGKTLVEDRSWAHILHLDDVFLQSLLFFEWLISFYAMCRFALLFKLLSLHFPFLLWVKTAIEEFIYGALILQSLRRQNRFTTKLIFGSPWGIMQFRHRWKNSTWADKVIMPKQRSMWLILVVASLFPIAQLVRTLLFPLNITFINVSIGIVDIIQFLAVTRGTFLRHQIVAHIFFYFTWSTN